MKLQKILVIGVFSFFSTIPVQAAEFSEFIFTFGNVDNVGDGYLDGYLSFTNSNLTGRGLEFATLSQLPNNTEYQIKYMTSFRISPEGSKLISLNTSAFSEPTFNFLNGELIGISTEGSNGGFQDGRIAGDLVGVIDANSVVSVQDTFFTASLIGTQSLFRIVRDEDGNESLELISTGPYFAGLPSGEIMFDTTDPIEPIPEPLTILGTATALGFGAFFKRKLKPSQSSEKETINVG